MSDDEGEVLVLSVSSPMESWVLDSGASFHSCSNVKIMEDYIFGNFGKVHLADDEPLDIVGKGNVKLVTSSGFVIKLNGITKGTMTVARGKKKGTLYTTTNSKDCIDLAGEANNADL
ncbi:hypothetical protein AAHA92_15764 [Salvia divinorum]|uniref:Retrovirus-related Pol polyprotein from transposon TNT 1-94-like beta-barrel domain-containing protein n=1 Tax=Salvia divinorum TaxID=28513 RepID=A0ABD1HFR9_SALDI